MACMNGNLFKGKDKIGSWSDLTKLEDERRHPCANMSNTLWIQTLPLKLYLILCTAELEKSPFMNMKSEKSLIPSFCTELFLDTPIMISHPKWN